MARPRRSSRAAQGQGQVAWSRPKLLALLAAGVAVAVLLVAGLAFAAFEAVRPATTLPRHVTAVGQPSATGPDVGSYDGQVRPGTTADLSAVMEARDELA